MIMMAPPRASQLLSVRRLLQQGRPTPASLFTIRKNFTTSLSTANRALTTQRHSALASERRIIAPIIARPRYSPGPTQTIRSSLSTNTSTTANTDTDAAIDDTKDEYAPAGDLFDPAKEIGPNLTGQTASIQRSFGPRSNSQAMLACGGEALAAHASFDPDYARAQGWIRHHAVGPAVLSNVLVTGLVGALVEATFPEAIPVSSFMKQLRPLIVGVSVNAKIQVEEVLDTNRHEKDSGKERERPARGEEDRYDRRYGYQVNLKTQVSRVRDDAVIAEGKHSIWIPDYLRM
jgi:hypothetical protein